MAVLSLAYCEHSNDLDIDSQLKYITEVSQLLINPYFKGRNEDSRKSIYRISLTYHVPLLAAATSQQRHQLLHALPSLPA